MWIVKVIVGSYITGMLGLSSPVAVLAVVQHQGDVRILLAGAVLVPGDIVQWMLIVMQLYRC